MSEQNARLNLESEQCASFEELRARTEAAWEAYLGKLACPWSDEEHLKRWGMLTERLREMFANTFVSDNVMRRGTVTQYAAAEWRAALEECFRETKPID